MGLTPKAAVSDLDSYVRSRGFRLSATARQVFLAAEELGHSTDTDILVEHFVHGLVDKLPQLRAQILEHGGDPNRALAIIGERIRADKGADAYGESEPPYSGLDPSQREHRMRTRLIDLAMEVAGRQSRKEIQPSDVIEALFEIHDDEAPPWTNGEWSDERLHVPFNTLSHMVAGFYSDLWIRFDDVRTYLSLPSQIRSIDSLVQSAPATIRPSLIKFIQDYPDYERNCFLIMSFSASRLHNEIARVLGTTLAKHGLNLLRADHRSYADELLPNVETYLYGCSFAIAVFERIEDEVYNPNVSLEVGYLLGLKKPICFLKERTLPRLHADLIGRLYVQFDMQDIEGSLPPGIEKWLSDKRII